MRGEAAFDVEFAYLHFEKRKLPKPSFDPLSAEGFLITPDGFFPYHKEDLTLEDFLKYDRSRCKTPPELVAQFRSGIGAKLRHLTGESTKSG